MFGSPSRIFENRNDPLGAHQAWHSVCDASNKDSAELAAVTRYFVLVADQNSSYLNAAARLHEMCLRDTVTSARGQRNIQYSYNHLTHHGHTVYVLTEEETVVGGLVVVASNRRYSPLALLLHRPESWILAIRRLGFSDLFSKLRDLLAVRRQARTLKYHDYIVALFVDEGVRRQGLARQLLERAINDSSARGAGLAVDTALSNVAAQTLYASLGFVGRSRTSSSVILTRSLE